jgi:hypothetical protein
MRLNLEALSLVLCDMLRGRIARRMTAFAIATSATTCVFVVPAFPQSNNIESRTDIDSSTLLDDERSGTGVARIFDTNVRWDSAVALPPNLIVPSTLQRVVDAMLRWSPTFRRQCLRIANAPQTTVALTWFRPTTAEHGRARTVVTTTTSGRRIATMAIQPVDDQVELIAHELEHVIEQLDEIDLRTLASVPSSGVQRCAGREEAFETIRAIRVGRAVAAEVRRNGT